MLSVDKTEVNMALMESDAGNMDFFSLLPLVYSLVLTGSRIKDHDITRMQMILLLALSRRERLLMSRVAQFMSSSREQATRAVDHLVNAGYVERLPDSSNRTHVFIHLTFKGTELLDRCHREYCDRIREVLAGKLSVDEVDSLNGHVAEVIRILDKVV